MKRYDEQMIKLHGSLILQRENEIILELRQAKDELKGDIGDLKAETLNGFAETNQRLDGIETDVSTLKTDVSTLKNDMTNVKSQLSDVKSQLSEIITILKK
jgi:outer membrane murein-binding lipoprotein Lpp